MLLKYLLCQRVILFKARVMAMPMTSAVGAGLRFEGLLFLLYVDSEAKEHFP
jgi:hypothetical protein